MEIPLQIRKELMGKYLIDTQQMQNQFMAIF